VRRLVTSLGLLLLVSATPACLLYTDRINGAPTVAIERVGELHPGQHVVFKARGSDPDGDPLTFVWSRVDKACPGSAEDWSRAQVSTGDSLDMVPGHDAFCLRLVAQDRSGAQAVAEPYRGEPMNRPPTVVVDVAEPAPAPGSYPLFSFFRLSAARTMDPDGDQITYGWEVRDGAGAPVMAEACPGGPSDTACCFRAQTPGTFVVTATANDGLGGGDRGSASLTIAEDQPPCIEVTDPTVDTPAVVLAVTDPPRRFEVRLVRDDGHPFPPVAFRGTSFSWYTAGETGPWTRLLGYEAATFDVSAARFEDARPGDVFRVRVEARDPAHDPVHDPAALRDLEGCTDQRVCEHPAGCVRGVGWKVQLQ
jgi:hypothetical protein